MKELRLLLLQTVDDFLIFAHLISALVIRVVVSVPVLVLLLGVALYNLLLSLNASVGAIVLVFTAVLILWIVTVIEANPLPRNLALERRLNVLKSKYEISE